MYRRTYGLFFLLQPAAAAAAAAAAGATAHLAKNNSPPDCIRVPPAPYLSPTSRRPPSPPHAAHPERRAVRARQGPAAANGDGYDECRLQVVVPRCWKWNSLPDHCHRLPAIHTSEAPTFRALVDRCWEVACEEVRSFFFIRLARGAASVRTPQNMEMPKCSGKFSACSHAFLLRLFCLFLVVSLLPALCFALPCFALLCFALLCFAWPRLSLRCDVGALAPHDFVSAGGEISLCPSKKTRVKIGFSGIVFV